MSLGLYFHLPFCRVHCTYCPFAISTDLALQDRYVDGLVEELASRLAVGGWRLAGDNGLSVVGGRLSGETELAETAPTREPPTSVVGCRLSGETALVETAPTREPPTANRQPPTVSTIYLGGGTPSRTSLQNLARLFDAIRAHYAIASDAEISMEANPEDVTEEAIAAWRAMGVNRLSIGVQSFHDDELVAISRIHDRQRALDAVSTAVASGVHTNLDLMLGLPHQTRESFLETLDIAVALGAGHLSLYMLDLEEKTPLEVQVARGRVILPEDDLVAELYLEAIERLARAGLQQYEISNFARPGEACLHNLRYWTRGEYLGFGIGAHSFAGGERFANTRDIRRYLELAPHARDFSETLGDGEVRRETIFLALRQTRGMCYEELLRLCGQEGIAWTERGLQGGWLRRVDGRVAFTPAGFLQSNDYISQLF